MDKNLDRQSPSTVHMEALRSSLNNNFTFHPSSHEEQQNLFLSPMPDYVFELAILGVSHNNKSIERSASTKAERLNKEICFKHLINSSSCDGNCGRQHPSVSDTINLVKTALAGHNLGPFPKLPLKWLADNISPQAAKAYLQIIKTRFEQGKLKATLNAL